MAYLGNAPARSFISFERQVFTIVNSQTAYTLSHSVTNENDIRLVINNIVQEPGSGKAYTASGTTLTLSAALTNGTDEMYCVFLGRAVGTNSPGAGSVNTAAIADSSVSLAKLTATGTKDSTTFLRGDNTFAVPTDNGKVLQVIHGSTTTSVTSSSSTEVSTGVTAQITPSSTSNKVLVFGSINGIQIGSATSTGGAWKIRRHDTSTSATSGTNIQSIVNYGGYDNAASDHQYALSFNDLDSPSTTAARNYTITFNRNNGSGSIQVQNNSATSSITLMEIVG